MESCDILIVGGGPAGSTLARELRNGGLDVLVLDKSSFPRDKVCAGWITPAVTEILRLDRDDYSRSRVLQPVTGFRIGMIGGRENLTRYRGTVSYGIRRSEFDHYLLQRSNARLRLGEPVRTMERMNGSWIVNNTVKAPLVVGAGGHFCPVSRFLRGSRERTGPVVVAQEAEFKMDESWQRDCPVAADTPELFFCRDLKGYGWCVRKGDFLNIGLGREDDRNFTEQVRSFVEYLKTRKRIPADVPGSFKGHAYALYRGAPQALVDDGAILVGDAAGLAYPKSGEGIRPAVESAFAAAEVILCAAGNYRRDRLLRYPLLLEKRFGRGEGHGIVPPAVRRFAARGLMASEWLSRRIVLDRWFLNTHRTA